MESGRYTADLDTWSALAEQTGGPVLDLGCGIGRVCHHLNRLGVTTVGLDLNPDLIEDFDRTRPTGSPAGMVGDAAALGDSALPADGGLFRLVVAPQQLVQILGGHEARMRLLRALPGLLEPDGLAAFAICEDLPEVDIHYPGVPPDLSEIGDWVHSSLPVAIDAGPGSVTALRLRQSLGPDGSLHPRERQGQPGPAGPQHVRSRVEGRGNATLRLRSDRADRPAHGLHPDPRPPPTLVESRR